MEEDCDFDTEGIFETAAGGTSQIGGATACCFSPLTSWHFTPFHCTLSCPPTANHTCPTTPIHCTSTCPPTAIVCKKNVQSSVGASPASGCIAFCHAMHLRNALLGQGRAATEVTLRSFWMKNGMARARFETGEAARAAVVQFMGGYCQLA